MKKYEKAMTLSCQNVNQVILMVTKINSGFRNSEANKNPNRSKLPISVD